MNDLGMIKGKKQLSDEGIDNLRINDLGSSDNLVNVYIFLKPIASTQIVDSYVANVTYRNDEKHYAVAWIDLNNLENLASDDKVTSVQMVIPPSFNSITTEGDTILKSNQVRDEYGFTGYNVRIGIISNGVVHISDSVDEGELPNSVHVRDIGYGDEGTAMLEIVHDISPNAELFFHSAGNTVEEFNNAIDELVSAGCTIICDDVGWNSEPYFEDGDVASHLKTVLLNNPNLIYVTAAGNDADNHYQGDYFEDGNHMHDFSGGSHQYLNIAIPPGEIITVRLQWNDKWRESENDYDLYLLEKTGPAQYNTLAVCRNNQTGSGSIPFEVIAFQNLRPSTINAEIDINRVNISTPEKTLELFISSNNGNAVIEDTYLISSDSIYSHAAVPEVITVGAINARDYWYPGEAIEFFSSQGPVTISYPSQENRQKPEICGIDNVMVSGVGGFESPFKGTSAAAPHIAGIVALAKEGAPWLNRAQIRDYLTSSAVDLGDPGWDPVFGYGRANATRMIELINPSGIWYTLSPSKEGNGTIVPSSPIKVIPSGSRTFTITPDPGYYTADVLVNGISKGPQTSYDFRYVRANYTIKAVFILDEATYAITHTSSPGGSISPESPVYIPYGGDASFTIEADPGYQIKRVTVDGASMGIISNYSFTNVMANHTIHADFKQNTTVPYGNYLLAEEFGRAVNYTGESVTVYSGTFYWDGYGSVAFTSGNSTTVFADDWLVLNIQNSRGNGEVYWQNTGGSLPLNEGPLGLTNMCAPGNNSISVSVWDRYPSSDGSHSVGISDLWIWFDGGYVNAISPIAQFSFTTTPQGSGNIIQFNDTSRNNPTLWIWDFGDNTTSTEQNPVHTYEHSGVYNVSFTASNIAGSQSAYFFIEVNITSPAFAPVAEFVTNTTSGNAPLAVQFTDNSINSPITWGWDFGDNNSSTEQNPVHTYVSAGNYSVNLTAANSAGSNSTLKTEYIHVYKPIITIPGQTNPPTNPDSDGLYEDINGNGRLDFNDVSVFFDNIEWIAANEPIMNFDFNGNGRIDFNDVTTLFNMI